MPFSTNKWFKQVNSIEWKLVIIFLLLIMITMQFTGVYFIRQLEEFYINVLKKDLKRQVTLLYEPVKNVLADPQMSDEEKKNHLSHLLSELVFLKLIDKTTPTVLIHIIDNNGFILHSTSKKEQHPSKKRFLFGQNTKKEYYQTLRDPGTNHNEQIFVKPIFNKDDRRIGSIYIESSLTNTYRTVRYISKILIKIAAIALLFTTILVVILARTITNPIKEITRQASAMARGNFNLHVDVYSNDEIGNLAAEFNYLASHLQQALSQKEEEKEKLESVLANMSDGVIATDPTGKVIIKNTRAEEILERSIIYLQSIHDVLPLSEPVVLPLCEEKSTFLEIGTSDLENQTISKITFTPIKLHHKVVGMIVLLEDVTEQEKLNRQRKEFVANVSHELRTPLTTIKSYLEALDDGAIHDRECAPRFVKVALQEADRMNRLIQDLLQLSRLDVNQSRFYKKSIDLETLLQNVASRFHFQCAQKNISITTSFSQMTVRVYIDQDKIEQVLDNVLSNALKYTSEGGAIAIVAERKEGGMIEVAIADSGIGIPKQDLGHIFDRFYRVDKARSRSLGGTGLGLSISQEIIQAHGGSIHIDSVYQKGTVVYFTLPLCEPDVTPPTSRSVL